MSTADEVGQILSEAYGRAMQVRPNQAEAIVELIDGGKRVLLVQRTGWGKSAVYFAATRILRSRGSGPTIIISPLLVLMRDQIENAAKLGVRAETFNSNNVDEWRTVQSEISAGLVDAILISPERFNNEEFREKILKDENLLSSAGLIVVDEAHCISDWGHDFRPDYRRIKYIAASLPPSTPILLTTATANVRVVDDIRNQVGEDLVTFRGELDRASLRLVSLGKLPQAYRLAWLSLNIPKIEGTGIVYCLTIKDVELVADWLNHCGIKSRGYSGDLEPEARIEIESELKDNSLKVVVATSALGMGYDKPDLSFVIHFQMPSSPVAYYQQVGRAGRSIDKAWGVLMSGAEDDEIWNFFLRASLPVEANAREVLDVILQNSISTQDGWVDPEVIFTSINMAKSRIESLLKLLDVEGFLEFVRVPAHGKRMLRLTAKKYVFDKERIARVERQRINEQEEMNDYLTATSCRMAILRGSLDDTKIKNCGRCDNCTKVQLGAVPSPGEVLVAENFVSTKTYNIVPRAKFPNGKVIPMKLRNSEGLSLSYLGNAGIGSRVLADKRNQKGLDQNLLQSAVESLKAWDAINLVTWIAFVPNFDKDRKYVGELAQALGKALDLPVLDCLEKIRRTEPQKLQESSHSQFSNVNGAYRVKGTIPGGDVLLVDDIVDSRWTLTVLGSLLRENGSGSVYPFTLARQKG